MAGFVFNASYIAVPAHAGISLDEIPAFAGNAKEDKEVKMDQIPVTKVGFEALEAELQDLKSVQRPNVIEAIATAREHGDLSENAEYHAAREQQSFLRH